MKWQSVLRLHITWLTKYRSLQIRSLNVSPALQDLDHLSYVFCFFWLFKKHSNFDTRCPLRQIQIISTKNDFVYISFNIGIVINIHDLLEFLKKNICKPIGWSLICFLSHCDVIMYWCDNVFLITYIIQSNLRNQKSSNNKSPVWFDFHLIKMDQWSRRMRIKTANYIYFVQLCTKKTCLNIASTRTVLLNHYTKV